MCGIVSKESVWHNPKNVTRKIDIFILYISWNFLSRKMFVYCKDYEHVFNKWWHFYVAAIFRKALPRGLTKDSFASIAMQWLRLGDDVAQLSSGNFSSSDSFDFFTLEIQLSNFLLFEWVIRTGKERRRKRKLSCLKNAKSQENDCIALQNHLSVQSTSRFGFEILHPI